MENNTFSAELEYPIFYALLSMIQTASYKIQCNTTSYIHSGLKGKRFLNISNVRVRSLHFSSDLLALYMRS